MPANYASHLSTKSTPQSEKLPNSNQIQNNAGGWSFQVDCWKRLERFICLGSESGSYYASERSLTQENAKAVLECAALDPTRTINTIVTISEAGRAPKNDPAIFALALLGSQIKNHDLVRMAMAAVPKVARTGSALFQFAEMSNQLRGWGNSLKRGVASWYESKPLDKLAYQCVKYQNRNGWSHRDLLLLCHPKSQAPRTQTGEGDKRKHVYGHTDNPRDILYQWVLRGWDSVGDEPHPEKSLQIVWAMERAKKATDKGEIVRLINDFGLVRECIPTQFLNEPEVWEALLQDMPMTAMIRSLAKMTSVGILKPLSDASKKVCGHLGNLDVLKRARIHPLSILMALRTYQSGHGDKGKLTWTPVQSIVDALDDAFYLAFDAVVPSGKNWLLGVDVSGSMSSTISGSSLSCAEASMALAMVTHRTEPWTFVGAFSTQFKEIPIAKKARLREAMSHGYPMGGTDCAQPMFYATQNKLEVDVFVNLTDSETWAGSTHPIQALKEYRQKMGRPAKMITVGMISSGFTIGDPNDSHCLDVVGFSTDVPPLMTDFARD